ncbi:MAG: glycoside hydrolase [Pseudomonadota bacterium]|nr:glycoside hydrolase [Pseudomonadota bacterium]
MRPLALLLLLCACSGGGGGSSPTPPPPPPPPPPAVAEVVVSGLSPFPAGCGGATGTVYINAEVEPYLAVDPLDSNHLIGVWQQDRWSNGSARGLATGVSFDGGASWTRVLVPFSECSGGNAQNGGAFQRATDPWVTYGPGGTAYQSALATNGGSFTPGSSNALLVSRTTDGGRTWSNPITVFQDTNPFFNDKEAITADPNDARFAYLVWDRLSSTGSGPTYFSRTTDSGATWEAARAIYNPGALSQTIGNLVRVLPDGTLVNLFAQLDNTVTQTQGQLMVIRSADRGVTWSAPIRIASLTPVGARDPATGTAIRDGSIIPQMAVAPGGALYVVWQDARFGGVRDAIAISRSGDGGLTWTEPTRVNPNVTVAAFTPQVHVRGDGTIGVTYYDLRSDTSNAATLLTDYWLARSVDGVSWTETRVAGPFDLATAPQAGGAYFLGDYMGLGSSGTTFLAFYARTTGTLDNRTDVFIARIPAGTAALAAAPAESKRVVAPDADRVSENLRASISRRLRSGTP